jgi:very-short-patch-repair endonuclease
MDAAEVVQAQRGRLRKIFEFLKAYTELRYPPVRNIEQQLKVLWLKDLPKHPSIELYRNGNNLEPEFEDAGVVLRITRPKLTACPRPPAAIAGWLKPGWEDINSSADVYSSQNVPSQKTGTRLEKFDDVAERSSSFRLWQRQREEWRLNERPARESMAVFQAVYEWFGIHERESERIEILVGDGLLQNADEQGEFNHPVLLQRLELEFYPEKQNPHFLFRKREQPPELYVELLRACPEANYGQIAACADELKKTEVSPLGDEDAEGFLRRLIQGVFPANGQFISPKADVVPASPLPRTGPSVVVTQDGDRYELSDPAAFRITGPITTSNLDSCLRRLREHGWNPTFPTEVSPTLRREPVLFMRQRQSGISNVFDQILQDIGARSAFPPSLLQIVGFAGELPPASRDDPSLLAQEDEDVLFSKPANKEQLEIARQLARRNCVLVQGPPGTGKTHTIANLLGHLLAQGKSVLVTAHTPKALRVLRHKVVEPLQPLCISVLQNDKQSQEELRQSVRLIHTGLSQDDRLLERDAQTWKQARSQVIGQLREDRSRLLDAVQDETRAIVFGGVEIRPIDAAKRVKDGVGSSDWIPGPLKAGAGAPLSHAEVAALYQTNTKVSAEDERELNRNRPDVATLPSPTQVSDLLGEIALLKSRDLHYRAELWENTRDSGEPRQFGAMLTLALKAIEFLRDRAQWQMEAIQAGRDGEDARRVWLSLAEQIQSTWQEVQECHALVMAHGPALQDQRPAHELLPIIEGIIEHIEAGKSFGLLTKFTKPEWHKVIEGIVIGTRGPNLSESAHFLAVRALLRTQLLREDLVRRWERQISSQGGPTANELGEKPEAVCRQFIPQIQTCLDWHCSTWLVLENQFQTLGFRWSVYLQSMPPHTGRDAELHRLREAVIGDLQHILTARSGLVRRRQLEGVLSKWRNLIPQAGESDALVTGRLRRALEDGIGTDYENSYEELVRLENLEPDLTLRRELLQRLAQIAPAWASAIENRHPLHSAPEIPGDPATAWEWRQLHDELDRRASLNIEELQQRIEHLSGELLEATSQVVEKSTWVNLIRKTTPEQRQALGSYAAMRDKLTKTGKGVQDPERRAAARREMSVAKGAVPVWIMPLNEVAESFDPRRTRFDVVVIDEASQCDPTAMFALYLGQQAVIVGDDEQVTPVAVGLEAGQIQRLRQVHLLDIPAKELYDGETSIYEFAQIAFGGVIRLIEHFRCVPNIIAFSNALSYGGEIQPLREATSATLAQHVLPYRVEVRAGTADEVNYAEAEAIASLICAAIEQPEYALNSDGTPVSFGVVSLVGDQQAMAVDTLLRLRLEPTEYKNRRILCGQPAQFQGDERDVIFLSLVDSPPADPPLPMRQEGPKKIFKKRFNVAASRARDQMWIVHSLNHATDLKPGDYRRRLIEHAIDPAAWERELERQLGMIDPRSREFEGRVLRRLMEANFRVLPQFKVGGYRIDLVVTGNGRRLAVECDGERYHGPEKLGEDMARQGILERLGWQFVRIRGSVFFRDEDRAMRPVFQRLLELGISPELEIQTEPATATDDTVSQRVIRRGEELRSLWHSETLTTGYEDIAQRTRRRTRGASYKS